MRGNAVETGFPPLRSARLYPQSVGYARTPDLFRIVAHQLELDSSKALLSLAAAEALAIIGAVLAKTNRGKLDGHRSKLLRSVISIRSRTNDLRMDPYATASCSVGLSYLLLITILYLYRFINCAHYSACCGLMHHVSCVNHPNKLALFQLMVEAR